MRRRDDFNEHLYFDRLIALLQGENMKKASADTGCFYSKARSREPAFAAVQNKINVKKIARYSASSSADFHIKFHSKDNSPDKVASRELL